MRAARYYKHHDIRLEDIDEPVAKEGEVIVDVEWTGICGSELHEWTLGPMLTPKEPHPLTGECVPLTLGHELCGRVRNPTPASGLKDGQSVMIDPRIHCGNCRPCNAGMNAVCETLGYIGGSTGGGYGERVVVKEKNLYPLDNIPIEYGAVIEPLAVVHHAVRESNIQDWSNKSVLVLGGGPIGFALLLDLKAHGATHVFVSEPASIRRKQVAEFAQAVIDPTKENVGQRCRELTRGNGVDVVFDCAGVPVGLTAAFEALAYQGHYIMVAVWEKPMEIPCWQLLIKHITFKGVSIFSTEDFREVMHWMKSGRISGYEKMVTGRISVEHIVAKGFEELINNKDQHIKIMVTPRRDLMVN